MRFACYRSIPCVIFGVILWMGGLTGGLLGQSREEKVRRDREVVESAGYWIYNDLAQARAEAQATGKPLVVVLRCIPCEECVKLDDELVDTDPQLKPLLDQFVRVRIVSTNGLDLETFQFDTDQSWTMFMLNADGTIYGRFGTRSHRSEWIGDVSLEGMAKALEGALELHKDVATNRPALAGKRGAKPEFDRPEKLPAHLGKYTAHLDWQDKLVASCIHCHQIGDAQRQLAFERTGRLAPEQLFPFPHPKTIGLILDPTERATVKEVKTDSVAAAAGLQIGDVLKSMNQQPLLSIADVQWVLHGVPNSGGSIDVAFQRQGELHSAQLSLPARWREQDDISWRASTWELRRRALGGLYLVEVHPDDRAKLDLPANRLCLKVSHAGRYAPHNLAYEAGVRDGDIVIQFDGHEHPLRETDLIARTLQNRASDDPARVTVLRSGQRLEFEFPVGR
jgi:hypothetical protein